MISLLVGSAIAAPFRLFRLVYRKAPVLTLNAHLTRSDLVEQPLPDIVDRFHALDRPPAGPRARQVPDLPCQAILAPAASETLETGLLHLARLVLVGDQFPIVAPMVAHDVLDVDRTVLFGSRWPPVMQYRIIGGREMELEMGILKRNGFEGFTDLHLAVDDPNPFGRVRHRTERLRLFLSIAFKFDEGLARSVFVPLTGDPDHVHLHHAIYPGRDIKSR